MYSDQCVVLFASAVENFEKEVRIARIHCAFAHVTHGTHHRATPDACLCCHHPQIEIDSDLADSHYRLGLARLESAVAQALYTKTGAFGSRSYTASITAARGMCRSKRERPKRVRTHR